MALLILIVAVLGVGGALSAREPILWGTFTQVGCEPARFHCREIGTWVSEDGSVRLTDVHLDGWSGDGTVRAGYRPTGFNNDADNRIVHVAPLARGYVWAPFAFLILFAAVLFRQLRRWQIPLFRGRTSSPDRDRSQRLTPS